MAHQENKELIQKLANCLAACEHCADACLSEENPKKMATCIRLDRDCADICAMALRFVARGSKRASDVVSHCADFCKMCGNECDNYEHEHCKMCAKACHECEEACRQFT